MLRLIAGAIALACLLLLATPAEAAKCGRYDRSTGKITKVTCPKEVRQRARQFQGRSTHNRRSVARSHRPGSVMQVQAQVDDRYANLAPAPARIERGHTASRPAERLEGVVGALAAKARQIVANCGSRVISGVRHTRVAGTRTMSLHSTGRAVDLQGAPGCIYQHLAGWPGGYSTDYGRVRHVHLSLGGREDGKRFSHGGGRKASRRVASRQ